MLISSDFNNDTQLERAFRHKKSHKSVEIFLQEATVQKSRLYKSAMMRALPEIIKFKKSQEIIDFFNMPEEEDESQCNLESTISSNVKVPPFWNTEKDSMVFNNIWDWNNYVHEIAEHQWRKQKNFLKKKPEVKKARGEILKDKLNEKLFGPDEVDDTEDLFEVKHSFVDFRYFILGRKLISKKESKEYTPFNDF